jgi:acetyl esterase/lipase
VDEPNETVIVDITGVTNATESGTQQVTVTIVDDDDVTVTLGVDKTSLAEDGSQNPATVTATLSGPSTQQVTVDLGFTGTATLTSDYTRSGTQIVIPAGSTSGSVTISAVDDNVDPLAEEDETVVVDITGVTNGAESGTQQVTVTIIDDDEAGVAVNPTSGLQTTESGGQAQFTVVLTSQPTANVTIALSSSDETEGTVTTPLSGSLTFTSADWDQVRTVTVTGQDDDVVDGNVGYSILTDPAVSFDPHYSSLDAVDVSLVNIDHDTATVTLGVNKTSLDEDGSDNPATVTATLSVPSIEQVTVNLGFSGTATNSTDYTRSGTQIVIPAGSTSGSVTINAVQDGTDEPNETVIVDITGVTNGAESGTQQVTVTIIDDDDVTVTLGVDKTSLAEDGSQNPATVTATLSGPSTQQVTVDLGFTGTATLTSDYTRSGTQIVIPAGSTNGSVTISAVDDNVDEPNETVIVDITGVTNGAESGTQQVTVTIIDDDVTLTELVITLQPSSSAQNAEPIPQQPRVRADDAVGNPIAGLAVTATIQSGGGTLGGTTTVATDGSGVAAFTNLSITGTVGARTLRFSANGIEATSSSIDIVAGDPTSIVIVTQPPAAAISGVTLTQFPVVEVEDVSGNPVPSEDVVATIETGGGSLGGITTLATNASGLATFSNLSISGSPGIRTLEFSAGAAQTTSSAVHVSYAQGTYTNVQYCGLAAQLMDVFVPSNSFARPLPVAAYIHGGGWVSGDQSEGLLLDEVRDELLGRGYVVVSLDHRLGGAAQWPAQINDVKCAVRHLRANAGDYGFDGVRIGVWGASTGGHLASMLGVTDATSGLEGNDGFGAESSRVMAAVAIGGISDMTETQALLGHPELAFGGPETTFASWPGPSAELTNASPITWASADDPPFLIVHGDQDLTVFPAQATRLFNQLDAVGVDVTLQIVTNGGHNLDDVGAGTPTPTKAQVTQQIADFLDTYVRFGS